MRQFVMLCGAAAGVLLAGAMNRAEAQYGYGTLRYGARYGVPVGGSVTSIRGPLGRVTVTQGPFGGGAVSVRGPFGGRITTVRPGVVPIVPPVVGVPYVPPRPVIVPQTILNPAAGLNFPYTAAYMPRIPLGYPTLQIAGIPYYYTPVLPPGSQPAVIGGATYYVFNGITYQPYFLGGQTVYVVIER